MISTVTPVNAMSRHSTSKPVSLSFKIMYPRTAVQRGIRLITKETSTKGRA
jgi:hypothetical protein